MKIVRIHGSFFKIIFFIAPLILMLLYVIIFKRDSEPIKIGILHSRTGTLAVSEEPVVEAVLLAIATINEEGGILGRKIVPVVVDGKSDDQIFARLAEDLIVKDKVAAIFGCWTSSSRKAVKPIVEKYNSLLFYSLDYEGIEASSNIIYLGEAPNQCLIPAATWSMRNLGTTFFLVGSDYIFPRIANNILRDLIAVLGGTVVGEEYIPLGSQNVDALVAKIGQAQPTVVLNSINGDSNIAFFKECSVHLKNIPIMSLRVSETDIELIGAENAQNSYLVRSYFQTIQDTMNKKFISKIKNKLGDDTIVNAAIETAYFGVKLWKKAVIGARSFKVKDVIAQLPHAVMAIPEGMIQVDAENLHTWKPIRIGKINNSGQVDIIWQSENAIRPEPYPSEWLAFAFSQKIIHKAKVDWDTIVKNFYTSWGNKWTAPG